MINKSLVKETLRYLGVKDTVADNELADLVGTAITRVETSSKKQYCVQRMACCAENNGIRLGSHYVNSKQLALHLQGCREVFLFAATLGADVDRLLRRDAVSQPSLAVAEQAAAAALIEQYCDDICVQLDASLDGLYCRPRFSAGYGDFSLDEQVYLLQSLDALKRIGLSCTDSMMLTPVKSVTAVIGISSQQTSCYARGCVCCSKTDCVFRKTT